jgi:hypothetical protein
LIAKNLLKETSLLRRYWNPCPSECSMTSRPSRRKEDEADTYKLADRLWPANPASI